MNEAAKVLAAAGRLREKCPVWWDICQRIALAQQWNREKYDELFESAVRFDPYYTAFYANKNVYLLPRWFGEPGECAAFAQKSADRLGGEEGDILYARLLWRLHALDVFDTNCIVKEAGVSWPRIRNGLEAILRRHPDSFEAASELCYLCGQQGERERMRPLFVQIGPFVDTSVYGQRPRFLQDRRMAFQP
jgi:hypothetical protein